MPSVTNRRRAGTIGAGLALLAAACAPVVRDAARAPAYVPDAGYHLVMAEIAIQRGQYLTAAQEYLTAAEQSRDSATARRATEFAFDYGFDRFALRCAQRWAELEPDSTVAWEYLGRLRLRRYDESGARRAFARVLGPSAQRSGDDYLALEADLAEEGNAADVLRLLQRLEAGGRRSRGWRLATARAALRAGRIALALRYAGALAADDGELQAQLLVARSLEAAGDADAALNYLQAAAARTRAPALELEFVRLLAASRREAAALEVLGRLIERDGPQPELLRMRALIRIGLGELDAAETDLNAAAASGQDLYETFYLLGEIEAARGAYEAAIRHYARIGAGGYLLPAQSRMADIEIARGRPEEALERLEGFAQEYPRYHYAMLEMRAAVLLRLGRREAALALYDEMLRLKPPTPGLLVNRSILLDGLGRRDAAIGAMREAVQLAPDDADALNSLGYTLALGGGRKALEEAQGLVRLAVNRRPRSAAILDSAGWVAYLRGELPAARSWLRLAWERLKDPEIAAHYGEVLFRMGATGAARRIWQEALIDHPDSKPLRDTLARFPR